MKKYDDRLVPARDICPSRDLAESTIGIGLEGVSVRSAIRSFPGQVVALARALNCGKIVSLLTARPGSRLRVAACGEGLFECFGIGSASDPDGRAGTWRDVKSAGLPQPKLTVSSGSVNVAGDYLCRLRRTDTDPTDIDADLLKGLISIRAMRSMAAARMQSGPAPFIHEGKETDAFHGVRCQRLMPDKADE